VDDTPRVSTIADIYPPLGLRITAGPLELRGISDEDIAALAHLAGRGIHPPDRMPFSTPWTDAPAAELPLQFARYHWGNRASFSPERWSLTLIVRWEGVVAGTQGFHTHDYLVTRTGETGSWLGLEHQGRGIGTRMRQAMCAFLFDCLKAREITSGAFVDNPASLAVSRKVGYRANGQRRMVRRPGEWQVNESLVLTPETLVRGPEISVEGLGPVRRLIGLEG
jgi:RimJ/RimL family protein N-acetyltransferase